VCGFEHYVTACKAFAAGDAVSTTHFSFLPLVARYKHPVSPGSSSIFDHLKSRSIDAETTEASPRIKPNTGIRLPDLPATFE